MGKSTACHRGHPWTDANTYVQPDGERVCRTCARDRGRTWAQKRRKEERAARPAATPKVRERCSATDDCPEDAVSLGYCNTHYQRWYRYGDPLVQQRIHGDDWARFWSKIDKGGPVPAHRPELGPCWVWTRPVGRGGYAQIRMGGRSGKMVLIHRWAYEQLVGEIPKGLTIDHLCRVRHCVRPEHLEPVTMGENTRRGISPAAKNAAKERCDKGHPFDEANTGYRAEGGRYCRTCQNEHLRQWRGRKAS